MKKFIAIISVLMPWPIKRWLLVQFLGYELHPTSRIGLALVMPGKLIMGPRSQILHLTICKGLDKIEMGADASIGRLNFITGFPAPSKPGQHFAHEADRRSELILEDGAGITNRHLIDCTNSVTIGKFGNIGGYRCQVMTHSADLMENLQSSAPISIGAYSLVGTACVILGGSSLPPYSVLSAASLVNKPLTEPYTLYGGVPARPLKSLPHDMKYFLRTETFVP
jgi:acetyltransferase-like isoleucine patch superfamily enzyme